jgi:hypothetical protein
MNQKTYRTSTKEIFTPTYDPTIDRPYTGNHSGFLVSIRRNGDSVTVSHFGEKGFSPCRPLIRESTHSISELIADGRQLALENGFAYECDDNLPEGVSYPSV